MINKQNNMMCPLNSELLEQLMKYNDCVIIFLKTCKSSRRWNTAIFLSTIRKISEENIFRKKKYWLGWITVQLKYILGSNTRRKIMNMKDRFT